MRFTAITNAAVLIEPPKLEAAKRTILVAFNSQNELGIQQLPYMSLVFDFDLPHLSSLANFDIAEIVCRW
jgi:hypothetical protein